jgi:hypothetical protein
VAVLKDENTGLEPPEDEVLDELELLDELLEELELLEAWPEELLEDELEEELELELLLEEEELPTGLKPLAM